MDSRSHLWLVGLLMVVWLARPALAFGAGNISSSSPIEGVNWRHGDIEDALLGILMARAINRKGKNFNKVMVARVYFGNWLRDYSQAVDLGTVKSVSYEAIRLVVAILGFMNFGFGSKEFEVTPERLGCYRPEEHIDNPKGYGGDVDPRDYYHKLRGPVDEETELAIDTRTGMLNYIANERVGIDTSAGLLRKLLGDCIDLGRQHARESNDEALYESMRLMGTALHCLEDFFAHSNYIELALIEMGERDVFPHVGRDVRIELRHVDGEVYPIVTGTFGEVDFLHSVAGEASDKLAQNEMLELKDHLENGGQNQDISLLRNLLALVPDSLFGGESQSKKVEEIQENTTAAKMDDLSVQAEREPEEITIWVNKIFQQIIPIIEWHDRIMKIISDALPRIPILPKIIEQLEDQLNAFVTAQVAPFVIPVILQIQNEMSAGSETIIQSSRDDQHRVFNDDGASDPTHSMLSKDHFTNLLNEPAGKTAAVMVKWVVPQIMEAIDDEEVDADRTIDRIIRGVLHHPAQRHRGHGGASEGRDLFFRSVEDWWNGMPDEQRDDYRQRLSREGVQAGENHKPGEFDTGHGHGCSGKLEQHGMGGKKKKKEEWDDKIATAAANAIVGGVTKTFSELVPQGLSGPDPNKSVDLFGAATSFLGDLLGKKDKDGGDNDRGAPSSPTDDLAYGRDYSRDYEKHRDYDDRRDYEERRESPERRSYDDRYDDHRGSDNGSDHHRHHHHHHHHSSSHREEPSYGGGEAASYMSGGGNPPYPDSGGYSGESSSYYQGGGGYPGGYPGSQSGGYPGYDSGQGGGGYGGYPPPQGGYSGYPPQGGYSGYPPPQGGYGGYPPSGGGGYNDFYEQRRY